MIGVGGEWGGRRGGFQILYSQNNKAKLFTFAIFHAISIKSRPTYTLIIDALCILVTRIVAWSLIWKKMTSKTIKSIIPTPLQTLQYITLVSNILWYCFWLLSIMVIDWCKSLASKHQLVCSMMFRATDNTGKCMWRQQHKRLGMDDPGDTFKKIASKWQLYPLKSIHKLY